MSRLPPGWEHARIGDVCEVVRGVTYKKNEASSTQAADLVPILTATQISDRDLDLVNKISFVPVQRVSDLQWLRHGDIVVAASSGSPSVVGKSAMLANAWRGSFGAFCTVLRPDTSVDPAYIAHYVGSANVRRMWSALAAGTNIYNLKREHLVQTIVPLPPRNEQRRIVTAIEERLSHVDAANSALSGALAKTSALLAVARARSVGGASWPMRRLDEVSVNFDGRRIPVKASDRAKRRGPFPYFGASGAIDTIDGFLFDGEFLLVAEDGANLVTRSKPIAFRVSGRFWVNNHAHVLQPTSSLDLRFLEMVLNGASLDGLITGTAQPKLTQANLSKLPIPVPPLDDQRRILADVDGQLARVDTLRAAIQRVRRRSTSLRRALLDRAFRGQLVPQDLSDEPASALLERIRTDRATEAVQRPRRRVGA